MLDIRLPIGLLFSTLGALLAIYGAVAGDSPGPGGHKNLVWGLCVLGFGAAMLAAWKLLPKRTE